jgi:hypothetical protein
MCLPVAALGLSALQTGVLGLSAASGVIGAAGAYQQGKVAQQVGRNNQIMAEYAAQDAQRRAGEDAIKVQQKASQLKGTQRATMAAKGLDLGVGTQADLLDQTDFFGATDVATTRNNGNRDAWSARQQGANARAQGDASARQGGMSAFSTLLGTAGSVSDKWMTYNRKGP